MDTFARYALKKETEKKMKELKIEWDRLYKIYIRLGGNHSIIRWDKKQKERI